MTRLGIPLLLAICACATTGQESTDAGPRMDSSVDAPDAQVQVTCDPLDGSGCPGQERCTIVGLSDGSHVVTCVMSTGAKTEDQSCEPGGVGEADDCGPGLYCSESMGKVCVAYCSLEPVDSCSEGKVCALALDLDNDSSADLQLCAVSCDLQTQDCQQGGHACYPSRVGPTCAPVGGGQTPKQEGELCEFANHCAAGLGCLLVGVETEWRCFEICDPFDLNSCGSQSCNRVEDEDWGICVDA